MASYNPTLLRMNVLLVDHDGRSLVETSEMLKAHLYNVTAVQEASVASSMISNGSAEFDLAIINADASNNYQGFRIARSAVDMGFKVILTSPEADADTAKRAIEDGGAFMFMQKPIASGELRYLWQHVLRENTRKSKANHPNHPIHPMESGRSTDVVWQDEQLQSRMAALQLAQHDREKALHPDFNRPFTSLEDACERLLPYHMMADYEDEEATSASLIWDNTITDKVVEFTTTLEEQLRTFNTISRKRELGELRTEERLMMEGLLLQETIQAQREHEIANVDMGQTSQGPREAHETVEDVEGEQMVEFPE